ncbi:MAG: PASTA domain-containing protein, partial [Oscillospiraceae bacterium]
RLSTASQKTVTDKAIGSVHYISPEQVKGQNTDNRSDLYSVGIMMYEMLTGTLPFQSETAVSVALQQLSDTAKSPRELVPEIPKGMEQIVMRAIEKDPQDRYQTAQAMAADLKALKENPSATFAQTKHQTEKLEQTRTVMVDTMAKKTKKVRVKKGTRMLLPIMAGLACAFALSAVVGIYFIFKLSGNPLLSNRPDVELPSFIGLTEEQLKSQEHVFKYDIERVYNNEYPKGTVFSQNPRPPKQVKEKSTVRLKISDGVMTSELPDLKNKTRGEAESLLSELGVNISVQVAEDEKVAAGKIIRTDPVAGTIITSGSLVTVYVSMNQEKRNCDVPNVIGLENIAAAKRALTGAGLRVGSYTAVESHDAEGTVIGQDPAAGTSVPTGSSVTLQ